MSRSRSMGSGPVPCVSPTRSCRRCSARLLVFRLLPRGFSNRDFATTGLPCWEKPQTMTPGQMTYHLRRLRLHGLIERIPGTHRYRVTEPGCRTILFCTRTYNRLLRPGLAQIVPEEAMAPTPHCAAASISLTKRSSSGSKNRSLAA